LLAHQWWGYDKGVVRQFPLGVEVVMSNAAGSDALSQRLARLQGAKEQAREHDTRTAPRVPEWIVALEHPQAPTDQKNLPTAETDDDWLIAVGRHDHWELPDCLDVLADEQIPARIEWCGTPVIRVPRSAFAAAQRALNARRASLRPRHPPLRPTTVDIKGLAWFSTACFALLVVVYLITRRAELLVWVYGLLWIGLVVLFTKWQVEKIATRRRKRRRIP
jgi:hypothetical protein